MSVDAQSFGIAAGLVVVALFGLVVVWKVTKSLFTLAFWMAAALVMCQNLPDETGCHIL